MNCRPSFALVAAALAFAGCATVPDQTTAPEPVLPLVVKIGHAAPLSGPLAAMGKDNESGARLAVDDLNAKGVVIGGRPARFELLAMDDGADPQQASEVALKLVASQVSGVVGHLNSGTSVPASAIYNEAGIPQITPSATHPKYTRQGFKTSFRLVADDQYLGGFLGKYAAEQMQAKTFAVIDDRTPYGQTMADEFVRGAEGAGAKLVAREFTSDGTKDISAMLRTIAPKKPDVIFFGGLDAMAGPMLRQMKRMGIKAHFVGGDGICTDQLAKLSVGTTGDRKVVCAEAGGIGADRTAAIEELQAKFKARFNTEMLLYAPHVYDAVHLMAGAMVQAGSAEPARYLPVLAKTANYKGVTGDISFDDKGDTTSPAVTVFTYTFGKRTSLGVFR
jgi:branched-chain amino acid transport system substrate-binding protein